MHGGVQSPLSVTQKISAADLATRCGEGGREEEEEKDAVDVCAGDAIGEKLIFAVSSPDARLFSTPTPLSSSPGGQNRYRAFKRLSPIE